MAHQEDRAPLLNYAEFEEEFSSGYDSPVFVSDHENRLTDSDSDHNATDTTSENSIILSDDGEADDLEDMENPEIVQFSETDVVISNIKYILSLPDMCDVKFEVGPQRQSVYGIRAIIGSRSQILKTLLFNSMEEQCYRKDERQLIIPIMRYHYEVFRQFIHYVHTGSITMDIASVVGLACAATEFEISDLQRACWDYLKHCCTTASNLSILRDETELYCHHQVTELIRQLLNQTESPPKCRETFV